VSVCFSNENKVKVTLSTSQTVPELLDMTDVKRQLSSSSAYLVVVDENGKGEFNKLVFPLHAYE